MKSDEQNLIALTPLTRDGTKRQWNAPQIIEGDLESAQKMVFTAESTPAGYTAQYGPS